MKQISALEFQRNLGKYQREAQRGPVNISHHGRRDLVLISAAYFDWLNAAVKRAHRAADGGNSFMLEAVERTQMNPGHEHLNEELAD